MKLTFSPIRMDETLTASVAGEVLVLNGKAVDLAALPEGADLAAEDLGNPWLTGRISRSGGVLQVTLLLPHGAGAPPETLFPDPVEIGEGPVPLPPHGPAPAAEDTGLSGD